jgi:hypothetical protein
MREEILSIDPCLAAHQESSSLICFKRAFLTLKGLIIAWSLGKASLRLVWELLRERYLCRIGARNRLKIHHGLSYGII